MSTAAPTPGTTAPTSSTTRTLGTVLRWVALVEALSWLALIVATIVKYSTDPQRAGGVHVLGPIHGALFTVYVVLAIVVGVRRQWGLRTTLLVLAESVIPGGGFLVFRRPDLR